MKTISTRARVFITAIGISLSLGATSSMAAPEMADGEIRKVDVDSKKITIKHGEIKNLDMPSMTMVFQVKDAAMLGQVKAGDKIKFAAEKLNGAYVITEIQVAK
jgi:Cu(I)/Ag(I) efflux system periplasmic protein CusF